MAVVQCANRYAANSAVADARTRAGVFGVCIKISRMANMSRFRLFLAWLVVAAIPLQGLAAASMLFCGMGEHHAPAQVAAAQTGHMSMNAVAESASDHSKSSPADEVQIKKASDSTGKKLPGAAHKCGVCASCCNLAAIAEFPQLVAFAPVPQAELAEPFVLIHARPSQVPDKPPRA